MNYLILLLTLTFSLTSCMQARDKSLISGTSSNGGSLADQYPNGNSGNSGTFPGFDAGNSSGSGSTTDSSTGTTTSTIPAEAQKCKWSSTSSTYYARTTNHLGKINVCQSSSDDKNIFIQVETPITTTKLCAIPMYEVGNRSIYIGNPRCLFIPDNKIYQIPLLKNRGTGYEQYKITSVMLIKDWKYNYPQPFANQYNIYGQYNAVDAFLYCSQALDKNVSTYCSAFNSINQHVYHSFLSTY